MSTLARSCSIDGCEKTVSSAGMCAMHYTRKLRHGDPLVVVGVTRIPATERFPSLYVETPSGCWEWSGTRNRTNYGVLGVNGRRMLAHRFSWEQVNGPIPDGLVIDHLCRNPPCVNPAHLEPVTPLENLKRSPLFNTGACRRGHLWAEHGGVRRRPGKVDTWRCRACAQLHEAKRRETTRRAA